MNKADRLQRMGLFLRWASGLIGPPMRLKSAKIYVRSESEQKPPSTIVKTTGTQQIIASRSMLVPGSTRCGKRPMAAHLDALLPSSNILSLSLRR